MFVDREKGKTTGSLLPEQFILINYFASSYILFLSKNLKVRTSWVLISKFLWWLRKQAESSPRSVHILMCVEYLWFNEICSKIRTKLRIPCRIRLRAFLYEFLSFQTPPFEASIRGTSQDHYERQIICFTRSFVDTSTWISQWIDGEIDYNLDHALFFLYIFFVTENNRERNWMDTSDLSPFVL